MRIAVTADLHWGVGGSAAARATRALAARAAAWRPDVFAIAGDVGEGEQFAACLDLFAGVPCERLVLPGNHDLWTRHPRGSSRALYREVLPRLAAAAGFRYLDTEPFVAPGGGLAVVGSMNWYDYSFADSDVAREVPGAEAMYAAKLFPNGRHNDGRFVRLGVTDAGWTTELVDQLARQLAWLPATVTSVVVLQHHPPVRELFYPTALTTLDQKFWLAYTGNRRMQELVLGDPRVTTVVCGHTHAACSATVAGKRCLNVGGDYGWKRLLLLDTDTGEEWAEEFGR